MSRVKSASFRHLVCFGTAVLLTPIFAAVANADTCGALSFRRNAIYKDAGYCFKTAAQIRVFGNAGCQFDDQADVPLSARQRAEVAAIVREERDSGCR